MRESSAISSFGVLLGSLLPGLVIVIFAIIWMNHHFPVAIHYVAGALTPPITNFSSMSILISILVNLVGMEMSAVHASNVDQPRKTYPRAILIAVLIILCVFIFTSLGLGVIVPADKIDLVTGVIQAISSFGNAMHVPFLLPILTALIAIGILTNASTWISGPSKGLQIAALDGDIPRFFQKLNKREMPGRLLIAQAILFTFLTLVFVFIPSVDSSYWILLALTGQLYMMMYFIMFLTGLRLRYKYPNVFREYRIPGRYNIGMWIVAGCGCIGTGTAFVMTYFPPAQLALNGTAHYVALLLISFSVTLILPVILFCGYYWYRKRRVMIDYGYEESTDLPLPEAEHLPIAVSEINSIKSKLRARTKPLK